MDDDGRERGDEPLNAPPDCYRCGGRGYVINSDAQHRPCDACQGGGGVTVFRTRAEACGK